MKKIISLTVAVLMLAFAAALAVSCESGEPVATTAATEGTKAETKPTETSASGTAAEPVSTTAATTAATTPIATTASTSGGGTTPSGDGYSKPDGYYDVDFGGRTFTFVTTNDTDVGYQTAWQIEAESRTGGTIVNTAIYDRNAAMKKLYNCEIKAIMGDATTLIANDVNSGTNEYDFGSKQYLWFRTDNKNGYYLNLYDLDLDMSIDGWNKTLFDQLTVRDKNGNKKLYTLDADFNLTTFGCTWVLFCNLDLYNQNFSDSIFDIVERGEWTMDKMIEVISAASQDNGDQTWTPGEDIFGLMTTKHNAFGLITSGGIRTVGYDSDNNMIISAEQILANNAVDVVDKGAELCALDGVYIGSYELNQDSFLAGKTLFLGEVMQYANDRLSKVDNVNATIIPEPLYSSTQDKYTFYVNNKASTYLVSKNAAGGDKKMVSDFLNVFVYHSNKIVYPEFLKHYGQVCCNDERTVDMLKIVTQGVVYDYSYYGASGSVMGLIAEMMHTGKNELNRAANKYQKTLQNAFDTYLDDMTASE